MSLNKFINHWEEKFNEWDKNPEEVVKLDYYKSKGKSSELVSSAFPEPYLGNPFKSSAVIINLNPGGVIEHLQDKNKGTFTNQWRETGSYLDLAKEFPYLSAEIRNDFWNNRVEWINRLLGKETDLKPFALELIPFHSSSFGYVLHNHDEFLNYCENFMLKAAEEALQHSELPYILSVGKPFVNIFESLNFEKIKEYNDTQFDSDIKWPLNGKNNHVSRTFSIWKSSNGKFYYNTWHKGGNKMPSKSWNEIENKILSHLN